MKHLLLVYHDPGLEDLSIEERRSLHRDSQELASAAGVSAHYRLRRSSAATTVRSENGGRTTITEGPSTEQQAQLRAVFVVESKGPEGAIELALQLPALRLGGTVEVWPVAG